MKIRRWGAGALAAGMLVLPSTSWAAGGGPPSTPDINVIAVVPAATGVGLAVTAHADEAGELHGSLSYRNGDVRLQGIELHRLWVPGMSEEPHEATTDDSDHQCGGDEPGVVKIRGLAEQRGVGPVQVWIDIRPAGHDGAAGNAIRVRVRSEWGCSGEGHEGGGHADAAVMAVEPADEHGDDHDGGQGGGSGGDHGAWDHNSGWLDLSRLNVLPRGN